MKTKEQDIIRFEKTPMSKLHQLVVGADDVELRSQFNKSDEKKDTLVK